MKRRPVIGITPGPETIHANYGTVHRYRISSDYVKAVESAGGLPLILPPVADSTDVLLNLVDGLLFSGGADIDPRHYGDNSIHPDTYDIDSERDNFELDLITAAIRADRPVLCICRGIQVLNVAYGGTLYQHIDDVAGSLEHRQQSIGVSAENPCHDVAVTPGSLLEQVYGQASIPANSLHHQAVRDPSAQLRVEGVTDDGIIEALSYPDAGFVLGVQWHPEMMHRHHPLQMKPFEAFITSIRATSPV